MMNTITSASSISAKIRSRTSKRDSCHKCFRAASRGRCTSMSRSSSASTVPNGGGWLNRFPNIGFVLENPGYASLPACHRHQSVFDRSRHPGNDAYLRDHFHRIEVRGFGVFIVKPRKRGVRRNPRTGQEVAIPTGKTIRFKPGKELHAHEGNGEEDSEA